MTNTVPSLGSNNNSNNSKIHLICLNESYIYDCMKILNFITEANISYSSENPQAVENSLRTSFL